MAVDRTISVINGKGGVFKTSIAANVGGLLGAAEYEVLVIDLDPQGNLGDDLGYEASGLGDSGLGLFQSISGGSPLVPIRVRDHVQVVPGGDYLHDLDAVLRSRQAREGSIHGALAKSLAPIADQFDAILLDCPPGQETMQKMALGASRWVVIPTKTDTSSRRGLQKVAAMFGDARESNPELALLGVVLCGVTTSGTRIRSEAQRAIEEDLGEAAPVFEATIRHVEAAAVDARNRGQLVHEIEQAILGKFELVKNGGSGKSLAASAPGLAGDYQKLAEELVNRIITLENAQSNEPQAV